MRSIESLVASTGLMMRMSRPDVSCFGSSSSTFLMSSASCARVASSQKTAGVDEARARVTASFTQSRTGTSFVWQARQMSPASTSCDSSTSPAAFTTSTRPSRSMRKVLSCEPYSSAFCAMRPTFGTEPIVVGSKAPLAWQSSITTW